VENTARFSTLPAFDRGHGPLLRTTGISSSGRMESTYVAEPAAWVRQLGSSNYLQRMTGQ
jgi:hypothetical protein